MGYRTGLAYMPRVAYDKLKKAKTEEELAEILIKLRYVKKSDVYTSYNDSYYVSPTRIQKDTIAEFWKYADFDEHGQPEDFFEDEEMNKRYQWDYELYIVNKEILRGVIEEYTRNVREMFSEKLVWVLSEEGRFVEPNWTDESYQASVSELMVGYKEMAWEWWVGYGNGLLSSRFEKRVPYNLQEEWEKQKESICNSWWYMYSVFELVRLYKTFDDKKNVLIYYGS